MPKYKSNVIGMLLKYHEVLGEANTAKIRGYCHRILPSSDVPFKQSPRKYDAESIAFIEPSAKELVQQGLIAEAPIGNAPYASSRQEERRTPEAMYRQLNALTVVCI